MKVSKSSKKEPSCKVRKLEEKLKALQHKIMELRSENRALRKKNKLVRASRDNWKRKNRTKANSLKGLRKRLLRKDKPKRHHYELYLIQFCVLLRVICNSSYRSIVKIIEILNLCFKLEICRIPCANTIENWVSKMGLYHIEHALNSKALSGKTLSLIIDESLNTSNERILLILILPSERTKGQGALNYEAVSVLYLGAAKSWTGEKIQTQIEALLEHEVVELSYVLSDEDSKLLKSARLLGLKHLPDINHAVANCLRKIYKEDETYQAFIKLVGSYAAKSVNQDLTYLRPPKQRIKARFMNQKPIICWALTLLKRFGQLNEKEQLFFEELKKYESWLNILNTCIEVSEQIVQHLKQQGLSKATLKTFKQQLEQLKLQGNQAALVLDFVTLLEVYAQKYQGFLKDKTGSYHVSSDVIESLFGKHKGIRSPNPLVGLSLADLELPLHCWKPNEIVAQVQPALEETFMTNLWQWKETHSASNQAVKRAKFFKKRA